MKILEYANFKFDMDKKHDISIPLHSGYGQVNAFGAPPFRINPVKEDNFVGSIKLGGKINFMNFTCNPHGNGTHTECVNHILDIDLTVNKCIDDDFYLAELISVYPLKDMNGDKFIDDYHIINNSIHLNKIEALIIRTLPNDDQKTSMNYTNTNPPFLTEKAMILLSNYKNLKHLVVDIPSIDKEKDEGKLTAHKKFWNTEKEVLTEKSITELVFINDKIKDNLYLLKLNISNISLDAVPSRPFLYESIT